MGLEFIIYHEHHPTSFLGRIHQNHRFVTVQQIHLSRDSGSPLRDLMVFPFSTSSKTYKKDAFRQKAMWCGRRRPSRLDRPHRPIFSISF